MGPATPPRKTAPATETATTSTQSGLIREDSSPEEFMTRAGESLREASPLTNLLTTNAKTRLGTWNIRILHVSGKIAQVAREMITYNIKVLGLCETRWNGAGQTRLSSGDTIIYSGHEDLDHIHSQGVALLMTTEATRAQMEWEPILYKPGSTQKDKKPPSSSATHQQMLLKRTTRRSSTTPCSQC